ncbi:AAA+-type ATPase [Trypanosoma theileri]|uniref:AAA+-type ATPase n=1 Tax=Trypanosoma theileri TaxID=67003 RepID=A0A1X0P2Y3_9TRYP|nr:AAA+-type ATPase [Trypanosoma theileri]ORC90919.1 AAA+-type ATPase [Trypanosoma theileri]
MDAYTSLLNLNFMSAWRTGNSLVDMIIAIIIPIVSNWVARFFSVTWPEFLKKLMESLLPKSEEVKIQHGLRDRYHRAVDLTEGSVLQEAIERYVNQNVKPFYSTGEFVYSLASQRSEGAAKNLAQILQQEFVLISRPSKEKVELGNGVVLQIRELDDEESEESDDKQKNSNTKGRGRANKGKRSRANNIMREIVMTETEGNRDKSDRAFSFVQTAFDWYVKSVDSATNTQRYLYQPVRKVEDADGGSGDFLMKVARYPLCDTKSFNSLFFPEKKKLITLIDQFENKIGKFAVPGFPHKLTLLLYGPPGTGKTSLVKAIARYTGRHIISIPLSQVQTNRELIACMHDQVFELEGSNQSCKVTLRADKVIYLLEDADATADATLATKETNGTSKARRGKNGSPFIRDVLSTKGLLEAFGGILDAPKRIIVMTTNHIERLDGALTRPGFITMRLHMGKFTEEYAAEMVRHYYGSENLTEVRLAALKEVLQKAKEKGLQFSPSEMEQLCAEYDDIDEFINILKNGSRQDIF